MRILGIHGGVNQLHHEPSAALLIDGQVVAAMEEERFIRNKNALGHIPIHSIAKCLAEASLNIRDIDLLVHPGETNKDLAPRIRLYMEHYFGYCPKILMINH